MLGKRENPCTPRDAVSAALAADAAQLSLATGQPVTIPSIQDILDGKADPIKVQELVPQT